VTNAQGQVIANIPVAHLNGSGDLTVVAGRNVESGAFYEGSGQASIKVGGSVYASWAQRGTPSDPTALTHPGATVLAVDTGQIALNARQAIDIAGIVSGPSLQNVADVSGNTLNVTSQFLSSYGPSSSVRLQSTAGDITANSLGFQAVPIIDNAAQVGG